MGKIIKLFLCAAFLSGAAVSFSQSAPNQDGGEKAFTPKSRRDPFLSKSEVAAIEEAKLAEQRRLAEERKRLDAAEKARMEAAERQRLLDEELRKNPAREVINKLRIDGILDKEAIINGQIKGIGDTVLGARVTSVSSSSVTFIYKGQKFTKKFVEKGGNAN